MRNLLFINVTMPTNRTADRALRSLLEVSHLKQKSITQVASSLIYIINIILNTLYTQFNNFVLQILFFL